MLRLQQSNGFLVETAADLPNFAEASEIVADFETGSGNPKETSFNPWHNCYIAGLAIRAYDDPKTYYITKEALTKEWIEATFRPDVTWTNHNVKYDANVLHVDRGHLFKGKMFDTMTGAKLINSDRWTYSLDSLGKFYNLGVKATNLLEPYLKNNKDYGVIPPEILGDYACEDVRITQRLAKLIRSNMPSESQGVFETEQRLTSILFEAEARGMRLKSDTDLELVQAKVLYELLQVVHPKLVEITGDPGFEPHKNEDCLRILHNAWGLPILDYTDAGAPSFSKHVFKQYLAMPERSEKPHHDLVNLCLKWKKLWQFNNLFLETYIALGVDDIIHPSYNQCVRTGRMSCRQPNMQQLDKAAKSLIIPRDGCVLISVDYAQVEFRIIVHYIKNRYALQAYAENPDTDFHTWVAEMVGIPRSPAKNINFMLGYGGGKKKTLAMLQDQPDLMNEIRHTVDSESTFKAACKQRANKVYNDYHMMLPELKATSNKANSTCRSRGYVRNAYGRRRHLPSKASYKAFNTICQSTAADLTKERAVALADMLEGTGAHLLAIVHDDFVIEAPKEVATESFVAEIEQVLSTPSVEFRVPIRCSAKISGESWAKVS